tara:strand:- start:169 stop:519 length:351 start_codon:yes stop_codon:yes gene_type:complete
MNISTEKMTFLSANYGLSPAQITAFAEAYHTVMYQMGGEIEASWYESGWTPEDPECAMIECLVDADRLEQYIPDYMDWCFDFLMKQELAHDLLEVPMPGHCIDYLTHRGLTCWQFV